MNPKFRMLTELYAMTGQLTDDDVERDTVHSQAYSVSTDETRIKQEPTTYTDAMNLPDADKWKKAMDQEFESLIKNGTWDVVRLPKGRTAVKCKWVYKIKYQPNGEIERYKARLVAKGYSQKAGIDYEETCAPVIKHDSVRSMFAIAAAYKMHIVQFDIATAFLNGNLDEEIYMQQAEGYEKEGDLVYKLKKSLYGLKQAARKWNEKFDQFLRMYNLLVSSADACVYYTAGNTKTIVGIHVDDGMACSVDKMELSKIIHHLEKEFEVKTGKMDYYVGFQVKLSDSRDRIFINQSRYIIDILERFGMSNCHPVATPADPGKLLVEQDGEDDLDVEVTVPYSNAVGSLMYASVISRPDISFAVSDTVRWNKRPRRSHWMAVKRIFRYLKGTIHLGILYYGDPRKDLKIIGYSDADFGNDIKDRKSRTGYVFIMGHGAIAWVSGRQPCLAQSTTESELIAANEASREVVWLKRLLNSIGIPQKGPTTIHCDNQSTIRFIKNPVDHKRTKHVDIRFLYVRERVEAKNVEVSYVQTRHQIADLLTKEVPRDTNIRLRGLMGMTTGF